jgi:hypothetical protein
MTDEINTILDSYHSNTLWEMASAAGLPSTDARGKKLPKTQVIAQMQAGFFTRERVLTSLARLNGRERAVLDRLLLRGGAAPTVTLGREVLRAGLVSKIVEEKLPGRYYRGVPYADGYAGDPGRAHSTVFVDVIARLTYHGLVFSRTNWASTGGTPFKLQFHPGDTLFVPEVIRHHLPPPEPIAADRPTWQPAQVQAGDPALLLRDLYLYWDFVRRNEVPLLQSGLVGKRSLRAVNGILLLPDRLLENATREDQTERLYLLRLLLEKLELVRHDQGHLRPADADPAHIPPFWSWPLARQQRACLDAWSQLNAYAPWADEVAPYSPRHAQARGVLLETLQKMAPGIWFDTEELFERLQDRDADFLIADHTKVQNYRGSYYYHYSGTYYSGSAKELLSRFERAERRFVEGCVTGFLYPLGITDLGQVGERRGAIRLTPIGQVLLGSAQARFAAPTMEVGKLVVQPNFQILAIGPASLGWLAQLDLFAAREQADRGAFQYRLSRDSIYRAQRLGMDVDQVLRFLKETSSVELPQNVRRSLEEWGAHHERIVFRSGVSLAQAADAGLLASLLDGPQTGQHLARSVSPEVALLKKGHEAALIDQLVEQGLFPAVSGTGPEAADRSVIVHEDGTIRLIHAVPSLHLRGRLTRVAEEVGDGTWRLTAGSVRRVGGSKGKVLHLLKEVTKLHRGTLPQRLVEQIKAWGGYYGNAAAGTLTLIEFRDLEALEELRQHPDLQPMLIPFPAGNRALAAVSGDSLTRVKEILARLGVPVRDGL